MTVKILLFLIDSQSAFTLLFMNLVFLQPKFFWDIWSLSDSLSSRVALSFQWVPDNDGILARQNRSNTFLRPCFQSASPSRCKDKAHPLCYLETKSSHDIWTIARKMTSFRFSENVFLFFRDVIVKLRFSGNSSKYVFGQTYIRAIQLDLFLTILSLLPDSFNFHRGTDPFLPRSL